MSKNKFRNVLRKDLPENKNFKNSTISIVNYDSRRVMEVS